MYEQPVNNPVQTPPQHPVAAASQKTDVFGILSIVFIFIAPLVGLILGLIGQSKAKKEGYSPTLSTIGWIVNLIFVLIALVLLPMILLLAVPSLQQNSRDVAKKNDLSILAVELDNYAANNSGAFPSSISEVKLAVPNAPLFAENGDPFTYGALPSGCTTNCVGYRISTTLESGGEYVISNLNQ